MSPPVPLSHAARIVSAISDFPNPNNEDAILAFMYPGHTFNLGESSSETLKQGFLSLYRSIYKAFDNEVSGFEAQITEAKDDLKLANGTIENLRRQVKDFTPKLVDAKEQLRRANGQIESLQDTIKDLAPKRKREDEEADEEDIDSSHGQKSRKIVSDDRVPMKPPRRTERAVSKSPEEILGNIRILRELAAQQAAIKTEDIPATSQPSGSGDKAPSVAASSDPDNPLYEDHDQKDQLYDYQPTEVKVENQDKGGKTLSPEEVNLELEDVFRRLVPTKVLMAGATYQPDALLYANQASAAAQIVPSIHATSGAGIVLQQYAAAQAASGLYKASNDSHQAHIQHISPLAHNQAHIQPHATQYQFQNQSHTHQAAARFMMPIPAYHNNVSTINHSSRQQPGDTGNLIQYLHDTHQLPNHQGGFAHPPLPQPQGLIMTSGNSSQDLAQLLASYTTKSVEQHPPQPWIGAPQSSQWPAVIPDQMHPIHPFKHALPGPPRRGCRYVYNKLYIKGLGFDINEHQLLSACSFAGTVVSVRIARDKSTGFSRGFGWVEFGSRVDADRAWDVLEGKALGGMGGNILRITYGDA